MDSCVKVPVIVTEGNGQRRSALAIVAWTTRFYNESGKHLKNCEGFPMFFTLGNFKKSLFGRHEAAVESSLASSSSLLSSSSL
jgi:hypothetical protein